MRKLFLKFKGFTDQILRYKIIRNFMVFAAFLCIIVFDYFLSLYLSRQNLSDHFSNLKNLGLIIILSQLLFVYFFKVNRGLWKYSSIDDLIAIIKVAATSFVFNIGVIVLIADFHDFIRFLIINHLVLVFNFGGLKLLVRLYKNVAPVKSILSRILIVGAGDGGEIACRRLKRDSGRYKIVGFLDDDPWKKNCDIHGIKVLGTIQDVVKITNAYKIDEIMIAIPSAGPALIRTIAEKCFVANVQVKIMPGLSELYENESGFEIRNLKLEDLLAREPVKMDLSPVQSIYKGKRVLVTGAAGSIGEELVKQVAQLGAKEIYLLDQAESPLYFLFRECEARFPNVSFIPLLCDITEPFVLTKYFEQARPQIVLHAAAYKHVPLLEDNIYQAMMVNVNGTRHLAEISIKFQVERFIFISTDKAVNPSNVLGATKRMAELLSQAYQGESNTKFIVVRFGNVIGSQGSVIPLFKKQIESGGPITVTHPEIKRYFMMIPEAVQLVLFASVLGQGGEIFVLDMGKQVKIMDLAQNMIRLCGFVPGKDIQIVYSGLRPGEKLYEELYDSTEKVSPTSNRKINMALGKAWNKIELLEMIDQSLDLLKRHRSREEIITSIKNIVKTYQPQHINEKDYSNLKQAI